MGGRRGEGRGEGGRGPSRSERGEGRAPSQEFQAASCLQTAISRRAQLLLTRQPLRKFTLRFVLVSLLLVYNIWYCRNASLSLMVLLSAAMKLEISQGPCSEAMNIDSMAYGRPRPIQEAPR